MPPSVPKPSEIQAHAGRIVHVYGGCFLSDEGVERVYSPRPAVIVEQVGPHSYIVNIQLLKRDEEASVILTGEKGAVVGQATVELYDKLLFVDRMDLFDSLMPAAIHDKKPVLWAEWPPVGGAAIAKPAETFPPDPAAPDVPTEPVVSGDKDGVKDALDDEDDTDKARITASNEDEHDESLLRAERKAEVHTDPDNDGN